MEYKKSQTEFGNTNVSHDRLKQTPHKYIPNTNRSLQGMSENMLRSMKKYRVNVSDLVTADDGQESHHCLNLEPTPHSDQFGPPKILPDHPPRLKSFPRFSRYMSNDSPDSMNIFKKAVCSSSGLFPALDSRDSLKYTERSTQVCLKSPCDSVSGLLPNIVETRGNQKVSSDMMIAARNHQGTHSTIHSASKTSLMRRRSSASNLTFSFRRQMAPKINTGTVFEEDDEKDDETSEFTPKASIPEIWWRRKLKEKNKQTKLTCFQQLKKTIRLWWMKLRQKDNPIFYNQIKVIDGHFGSGTVAFFIFLRWIFQLNLVLSILWVLLVVIPTVSYFDHGHIKTRMYVTDIFLGEGWFEESWMFYGQYDNMINAYPLALVYIICVYFTYFGGFFFTLRSLSIAVEEEGMTLTLTGPKCNLVTMVLTSWDYSLTSREASRNLSFGITNTFKEILREHEVYQVEISQSRRERVNVFMRRTGAWIVTLCLGSVGCIAIFQVLSADLSDWSHHIGIEISPEGPISKYGPVILFITINLVIPEIIYLFPWVEKYERGQDEIYITILRVFVFRIVNTITMMISLQEKIKNGNFKGCAGNVIGKEFYKLVNIDTMVGIVVVLVPNTFMYYCSMKKQELEMPARVLAILYRQALIWLGCMFCPVMPVIGMISTAIFFLTNHFMVMKMCKPPEKLWHQPQRSTFFVSLTSVTLIVVIFIVVFIIGGNDVVFLGGIKNSTALCGPFDNTTNSVFGGLKYGLSKTSPAIADVLMIVTSARVIAPFTFFLLAVLYYQRLKIQWLKKCNAIAKVELEQERDYTKKIWSLNVLQN